LGKVALRDGTRWQMYTYTPKYNGNNIVNDIQYEASAMVLWQSSLYWLVDGEKWYEGLILNKQTNWFHLK